MKPTPQMAEQYCAALMAPKIDIAELHRRFSYDAETGALVYRIRFRRFHKGDSAGCECKATSKIDVGGRTVPLTSVIWAMQTGEWPALAVDHANRNWRDNSWANLRLATTRLNNANRRLPPSKRGTARGVRKVGRRFSAWRSHTYLGTFDTPREAHIEYLLECLEEYGEFAYFEDYVAKGIYL